MRKRRKKDKGVSEGMPKFFPLLLQRTIHEVLEVEGLSAELLPAFLDEAQRVWKKAVNLNLNWPVASALLRQFCLWHIAIEEAAENETKGKES